MPDKLRGELTLAEHCQMSELPWSMRCNGTQGHRHNSKWVFRYGALRRLFPTEDDKVKLCTSIVQALSKDCQGSNKHHTRNGFDLMRRDFAARLFRPASELGFRGFPQAKRQLMQVHWGTCCQLIN